MTVRLPAASRDASTNSIVDRLDVGSGPGTIKIYTGAQPASAGDAATGTLLATVTLQKPAFGDSVSGAATLADPASVNAVAGGTAGWFRAADSAGSTVFDGSVSDNAGAGDLKLSNVVLASGGAVDLTGGSYTTPAG